MPIQAINEILTSRDQSIDRHINDMQKHTEYMEGFKSALGAALVEVKSMRETLTIPKNTNIGFNKNVLTCDSKTQTSAIADVFFCLNELKNSRVGVVNASSKLAAIATGVRNQNKHIEALREQVVKSVCVRVKRERKLEEKLHENRELKRKNLELTKLLYANEKSITELKTSLKMEKIEVQKFKSATEAHNSALGENKILLGQLSQLRKCLQEKDREIAGLRSEVGRAEYLDVRKQNTLRSQHTCASCDQLRYERDSNYNAYQELLKETNYYKDRLYDLQRQSRGNDNSHNVPLNDATEYTKTQHVSINSHHDDITSNTLQLTQRNHYFINPNSTRSAANKQSSSRQSTPVSLYPIDESDEQMMDDKSVNNYMEPVGAKNRNSPATPVKGQNTTAQNDAYSSEKDARNSTFLNPAKQNIAKKETPTVCINEDYLHGNTEQLTQGIVWHPQLISRSIVDAEHVSSESGSSENYLHAKKKKKSPKYSRSNTENLPSKSSHRLSVGRFVKYKGHEIDVLNFSIHNFREILWDLESESAAEPQTISNDFLKFLSLLARKLNDNAEWSERHSLGKPTDWLALRGLV